ncbi:MAG: hypothetical protein AAF228_06015 [Pseudomonadota bacterium]
MTETKTVFKELATAKKNLKEAIALQALENNPLSDKEILLVNHAISENWTDEQWNNYLLNNISPTQDVAAE